ncbi:PAAR domain-containing protein [Marivita sp.]|uniref:PAAR domain-containing protein n=1 Tax=Marivita sp. TaxID=2003365 RepID=UPI00345CC1A2
MPGMPQARMLDLHTCFTPGPPPAPPVPVPVPLPIIPPCCATVLVGKLPAARMTDLCNPAFPHPILKGSMSVLISKIPAARVGDTVACGGVILKGEFTVLVGG